jgi:murein DD-endopeptidase MepM/ murein hydrolase activator NlpD
MSGTVVGIVNNVPQGLLGYSEGGFGNLIIVESTLENGEKIQVLYAHLNEVNSNLHYGSAVTQGSSMGLSGNTGNAFKGYKPHIHIQISINGQKIDAEPYIRTKFTANGSPIITPC